MDHIISAAEETGSLGLKTRWNLTQAHPQVRSALFALQVCVEPWTFVNVYVDGTKLPDREQEFLLENSSRVIDLVLESCRLSFSDSVPRFLHVIWAEVKGVDQVSIVEKIPPQVLRKLPAEQDVLPHVLQVGRPPVICLDELDTRCCSGHFLPAGVRMVRHKGQDFVAKGPIYPSSVDDFVAELKRIVSLAVWNHPNIIASPQALLSVAKDDQRICGFLMPFFPHGNLDTFTQKMHAEGSLRLGDILRWLRQLAGALIFLRDQETWHGDIKPDNLLVTDAGDVQLTDFTRSAGTSITASPEVRAHCRGRKDYTSVMLGVPSEWPINQIMASEVYSIGRTMFIVMTAQSMVEMYRIHGWVSDEPFPTCFDEHQNCHAQSPDLAQAVNVSKDVIVSCVQQLSHQRIGLEALTVAVKKIESEWQVDAIKIEAA